MEDRIIQAEKDYMSGMKYKDIADKYDISINTVKSWKTRYGWNRKGVHTKKGKSVHTKNKPVQSQEHTQEFEEVENEELTEKQMLFCIYYIRCFNATKAYQKAYQCDYKAAAASGSRLLKNAKVKNEIKNLKQNRINRDMLSEDDIFQKYMDIAFADMNDYMEIRGGYPIFKDSSEFDGTLIKKISSGKTNSIELQDQMKALQWLSDHMDLATEKQKAEIAALRAKSADDSEEEKKQKKQAKENIANILKQMHELKDEDVYE